MNETYQDSGEDIKRTQDAPKPNSSKECSSCKITKPLKSFYKKRNSVQYICKACQKIVNKKYYGLHKERVRNLQLSWNYNITFEEYRRMLYAQDGRCRICRVEPKSNKALCVDHCHATKEVRGLLCDNCNRGLGYFKDSVKNLEEAVSYLKS